MEHGRLDMPFIFAIGTCDVSTTSFFMGKGVTLFLSVRAGGRGGEEEEEVPRGAAVAMARLSIAEKALVEG
jgi:hypothetical protein